MLKKCISMCVLVAFLSATTSAFAGDFANSNPLPRDFSLYSPSSTPMAARVSFHGDLAFLPRVAGQNQDQAQPSQTPQPQPVAGPGTWNKVTLLQPGTGIRVTTSQGTVSGIFASANADSMALSFASAQKTIQKADVQTIYQVAQHHRRDVILGGVFAGLAGLSVGVTMAAYADRPSNSTVTVNPAGLAFLVSTSCLSALFFMKSRSKKIYSAN
jgi:hypothetical protein